MSKSGDATFSRRNFVNQATSWSVALVAGSLSLALWQEPAWAGSYLTRAATLLRGAELEARTMNRRLHDRELARTCHELALARVEAARTMLVPKEVKNAHPHLLLTLESYERALDAAVRREPEDFLISLARAREEERILVAMLKQDGWELPRLD